MSQWIIWNLLFRLHERLKGHATYRFLGDIEAIDRLSEVEVAGYQQERLGDLIRYAYAHVPYYQNIMRERSISPSGISTAPATSQ